MKRGKLIGLGTVLVLFTGVLFISKIRNIDGLGTSALNEYKDIDQLKNSTSIDFRVPELLTLENNIVCTNLYGQLVEIRNDEVIFRAANFIDDKADISGEYDDYKTSMKYGVTGDTEIQKLRIRTSSDSLNSVMNGVLLNYDTGNVSYSLKINMDITFKEILNMLELEEGSLSELDEGKDTSSVATEDMGTEGTIYKMELIDHMITIPKIGLDIKTVEGEEEFKYATFIIAGKAILSIDNYSGSEGSSDVGVIKLEDGYRLIYKNINTFDDGTSEYIEYNKILNSLSDISESFKRISGN